MRKPVFNSMALSAAGLVSALALGACSANAEMMLLSDGPQIELRDLVARIVVTPEQRNDVDIRVRYGKAKIPVMMVSHRGNTTILDGHLSNNSHMMNFRINIDIDDSNQHTATGNVFIQGVGPVDVADLPLVFIRVPMNAVVKDSAYSFGHIGPSNSLDFVLNGSGDWSIDPVNGPLNIIDSGSGNVRVASAGDSVIDNMGSSDIQVSRVRNLKLSLSGSGNFTSGQSADTVLQNQGSGDVTLGRVGSLKAMLNGSGDLNLEGVGGNLSLTNNGSSDVRVERISGPTSLDMSGSGDVRINGGQAPVFIVKGSGSGDVNFGGVAGTVNIETYGSGDINITKASGAVTSRISGSGEMHIGH